MFWKQNKTKHWIWKSELGIYNNINNECPFYLKSNQKLPIQRIAIPPCEKSLCPSKSIPLLSSLLNNIPCKEIYKIIIHTPRAKRGFIQIFPSNKNFFLTIPNAFIFYKLKFPALSATLLMIIFWNFQRHCN